MFPEWRHAVPKSAYFQVPETITTFRMPTRFPGSSMFCIGWQPDYMLCSFTCHHSRRLFSIFFSQSCHQIDTVCETEATGTFVVYIILMYWQSLRLCVACVREKTSKNVVDSRHHCPHPQLFGVGCISHLH